MHAEPIFSEVPRRIVLHIDLDCFYCQVEQKRLGIARDVPCAVQQWEGLIAVNYAARARGVTRHMRVFEAKQKCPEIQLLHVETIGGDAGCDGASSEAAARSRGSVKASLQRYRQASAEIMKVLQRMAAGCVLERAGIDEAFVEVTGMVAQELHAMHQQPRGDNPFPAQLLEAIQTAEGESRVQGGPLDPTNDFDCHLAVGACIAKRMRRAVYEELGFTCSAGVASNKLLAKLGSALNKPNKQAVVTPRAVQEVVQELALSKIRGLGGKLGSQLEQLGCTTAGDVQRLPYELLVSKFQDKARWVASVVRGLCDEPVACRDKVKSINSCKSFEATADYGVLARWMAILADELAERMAADEADHHRRPKSLVLQYRGGAGGTERSVRCAMPQYGREGPAASAMAAAAVNMLRKAPDALPCRRLALSAAEFQDAPAAPGAAISRFFRSRPGASSSACRAPAAPSSSAAHSAPACSASGHDAPADSCTAADSMPGSPVTSTAEGKAAPRGAYATHPPLASESISRFFPLHATQPPACPSPLAGPSSKQHALEPLDAGAAAEGLQHGTLPLHAPCDAAAAVPGMDLQARTASTAPCLDSQPANGCVGMMGRAAERPSGAAACASSAVGLPAADAAIGAASIAHIDDASCCMHAAHASTGCAADGQGHRRGLHDGGASAASGCLAQHPSWHQPSTSSHHMTDSHRRQPAASSHAGAPHDRLSGPGHCEARSACNAARRACVVECSGALDVSMDQQQGPWDSVDRGLRAGPSNSTHASAPDKQATCCGAARSADIGRDLAADLGRPAAPDACADRAQVGGGALTSTDTVEPAASDGTHHHLPPDAYQPQVHEDVPPSADLDLMHVSVAEQRRILHDIEIQRMLSGRKQAQDANTSGIKAGRGRRPSGTAPGRGAKQARISTMFAVRKA